MILVVSNREVHIWNVNIWTNKVKYRRRELTSEKIMVECEYSRLLKSGLMRAHCSTCMYRVTESQNEMLLHVFYTSMCHFHIL